jgi:CRISPR system Cascade subunit CasA
MPPLNEPAVTYNLWDEPWIALEHRDGQTVRRGIRQALLEAHEHRAIFDPSPLVVVGIHRLLVAILQGALDPRRPPDIWQLWQAGQVPAEAVQAFAERYLSRFDLFSAGAPFLQSADLALRPGKTDRVKSVAYLAVETPAGTAITHYRHGSEESQAFCPACAAGCLVTVPAFATSGGAGIKPSVNGVPPIYVIPGGESLFESLVESLILPQFQPRARSTTSDLAWWVHPPIVKASHEVVEVGYLHSLTFPARRIRLHPEPIEGSCTRCGELARWGVRTMVFDMGESRPRDAPPWNDPFAAYRIPTSKEQKAPTPVRPTQGTVLWREFAGLFLEEGLATDKGERRTQRPAVLDQMAVYGVGPDLLAYPFRCVGLRTDMKAKVFEWIDSGFEVPPALLRDPRGALAVREAIQLATECAKIMATTFRSSFGGPSSKQERYRSLKGEMLEEYWATMAEPFGRFVLAAAGQDQETARRMWASMILQEGRRAFKRAADAIGDDAASLRDRVQGEQRCQIRLAQLRKEYLAHE